MHSLDYTHKDNKYDPSILQIMETLTQKDVSMKLEDIKKESRFWIIDYPIVCYITHDRR